MVEWRLTPEYIINNWTDELFSLMAEKMSGRRQRRANPEQKPLGHTVPEAQFFDQARNLIKVVKR